MTEATAARVYGTASTRETGTPKDNTYDLCVAIGPMIMMKFVCLADQRSLVFRLLSAMNPIMVDGTGMCGACRVMVGDEVKFACVDGPEFDGHLVDFDQAMKRQQMYKDRRRKSVLETA